MLRRFLVWRTGYRTVVGIGNFRDLWRLILCSRGLHRNLLYNVTAVPITQNVFFLRLQYRKVTFFEIQALADKGGVDPFIVVKNPSSSKGGVMEKYIKVHIIGLMHGGIRAEVA